MYQSGYNMASSHPSVKLTFKFLIVTVNHTFHQWITTRRSTMLILIFQLRHKLIIGILTRVKMMIVMAMAMLGPKMTLPFSIVAHQQHFSPPPGE